ncbi:MAG: molybdopterin molybdotransferase MoeA [Pseudomonadota bacterium]
MGLEFNEALDRILSNSEVIGTNEVSLFDLYEKAISEDFYSDIDYPKHDIATVDGYACRFKDVKCVLTRQVSKLKLATVKHIDNIEEYNLNNKECVKVRAGSKLPASANVVIPLSSTKKNALNQILVYKEHLKNDNIKKRGDTLKKGECVIEAGENINASHIGIFALTGKAKIPIFKKPKVSVIVIGEGFVNSEMHFSFKKNNNEFYDANGPMICSLCKRLDADVEYLGTIKPDKTKIRAKIQKALKGDIVITTGCLDKGINHFTKEIIKEFVGKLHVDTVNMVPGGQLVFGKTNDKIIFGLPGNPAASMVAFYELVRPSILNLMGRRDLFLSTETAILENTVEIAPGRTYFLSGVLKLEDDTYYVSIKNTYDLDNIISYVTANCLVPISPKDTYIKKGEKVTVQRLKPQAWHYYDSITSGKR